MDIEKCRALLCTLETGSLSAASEELGYTPSGISRMMASLEEETGFELLIRSRNGIKPTENCKKLLPIIREMVSLGDRYKQTADEIKGLVSGTVTVGNTYLSYYSWLARLIADFGRNYPNITVRIIEGTSSELITAIEEQRADFCIISHRSGDYDWIHLKNDEMVAWVPPNHKLAAGKTFPLKAVTKEPFIEIFPGQETDNSLMFASNHIKPNTKYVSLDSAVAYSMVEAGLGISTANAIVSDALNGDVNVLPLDPPQIVDIGVAIPREKNLSPAAKHFVDFAKKSI